MVATAKVCNLIAKTIFHGNQRWFGGDPAKNFKGSGDPRRCLKSKSTLTLRRRREIVLHLSFKIGQITSNIAVCKVGLAISQRNSAMNRTEFAKIHTLDNGSCAIVCNFFHHPLRRQLAVGNGELKLPSQRYSRGQR
jgi:hypothetical protein